MLSMRSKRIQLASLSLHQQESTLRLFLHTRAMQMLFHLQLVMFFFGRMMICLSQRDG
jgi:hypothetical protein